MAFEIVWTIKAVDTYAANIEYLKEEWSDKEVRKFAFLTKRKLEVLKRFPFSGISQSSANENIRCTVLHKRVNLIYRVNSVKGKIELLLFWNTWQNPSKFKV
ncbi:type II toxin-antitoxin system RelE/ParE family toxin [Dyadobacter sp. CY312]|uniref:type II toxin-antitoxin system RelE/ParE family toxin n=1 Tax=Dyadobacter sp. CY312 TaxID=2907303 RepID=UPI001F1F02E4|nr:hypothetical protein [Dyadobacter sp. CY312]MCE7039939.1 hypothetical protein [Dyadobacter sp. CY312]